MVFTPLRAENLDAIKKSLRDEFSDAKSSHLSEALAFSLGFRTNAALVAAMAGPERDRPFVFLNSEKLRERLVQLGYEDDPEFDAEVNPLSGTVPTIDYRGYEIQYESARQKAWRNLMVCAVNAALHQKLFTLHPGDNRFEEPVGYFFFKLPNGMPVKAKISDAGFDEIEIHAAVNPKERFVDAAGGLDCGDAVGMTWVERRRGVWMQSSMTPFSCRRGLLNDLAEMNVEPNGFGDRGRVIM